MLELLTCTKGHFWEAAADGNGRPAVCPECGAPADCLPLLDLAPSEVHAPATEEAPLPLPLRDAKGWPVVAGYEVLEDLGRSPTGVARYRARQVVVNRPVLLEVVWAREDPGQTAWGSLRGKASGLARLRHPLIVQVHDAGERDRQLFYNALEFVEGPTLEEMADRPLPPVQVVPLVEALARAVDHAHRRGVVHRSLGPACILLQPADKVREAHPNAAPPFFRLRDAVYLPRLTDFGLARRPIEGDVNDMDLYAGRPDYLAPEQAWGRAREIGPGTDVYALGALLYRLVAGRPPFLGADVYETIEAIQSREPLPLQRARRGVSDDLAAVCRKCLQRAPRRRYASALDLADDLRRLREGQPVRARTASSAERLGKWVRRRPALAALLAVNLLTLVALLVAIGFANGRGAVAGQTVEQARMEAAQARAQARTQQAELEDYRRRERAAQARQQVAEARQALDANQTLQAGQLLDRVAFDERHWEWYYLRQRARGQEPRTLGRFELPVTAVAYGPDGSYVAAAGRRRQEVPGQLTPREAGEVRAWLAPGWFQTLRQADLPGPVFALAFSPDGRCLAEAGAGADNRSGQVRSWRLHDSAPLFTANLGQRVTDLVYYIGGSRLVAAEGNGVLHVLMAGNGFQRSSFGAARWGLNPMTTRLAVNTSDTYLATASPDEHLVTLWNPATHSRTSQLPGRALSVAFGGDDLLATGGADGVIHVHKVGPFQARLARTLRGHRGAVAVLAFSGDGKRLVSSGQDGSVRVWDPEAGVEVLTLTGFGTGAGGLAFSPSGHALVVANGHDVILWGSVTE